VDGSIDEIMLSQLILNLQIPHFPLELSLPCCVWVFALLLWVLFGFCLGFVWVFDSGFWLGSFHFP